MGVQNKHGPALRYDPIRIPSALAWKVFVWFQHYSCACVAGSQHNLSTAIGTANVRCHHSRESGGARDPAPALFRHIFFTSFFLSFPLLFVALSPSCFYFFPIASLIASLLDQAPPVRRQNCLKHFFKIFEKQVTRQTFTI